MKHVFILLLAILPAIVPAQTVAWTFENRTFATGDTVEARFSVTNFTDIAAFQYTLKWDTAALNMRTSLPFTFSGALPGYAAGCWSYWGLPGYALKPGEIRTLYSTATGKTVSPGAHVCSIWFVAKKSGSLCGALNLWNKAPLWSVAYKGNLSWVPQTVACYTPPAPAKTTNAAATDRALLAPPQLVDMQVAPNPLTDTAHIDVFLENAGPVLINVYDAAGYAVHGSRNDHPGGSQRYDIALPAGAPGTYFITVQTPAGRLIEKVQKI